MRAAAPFVVVVVVVVVVVAGCGAGDAPTPPPPPAPAPAPAKPTPKPISDDALIEKAAATSLLQSGQWELALASTTKLIALAPEWADAHRLKAEAELVGSEVVTTSPPPKDQTWRGVEAGDYDFADASAPATYVLKADGSFIIRSETSTAFGKWTKTADGVSASDDSGYRYTLKREGNKLKGGYSGPDGQGGVHLSCADCDEKPVPDLVRKKALLEAAAADLRRALELAPDAADRQVVIGRIAEVRVKAAAIVAPAPAPAATTTKPPTPTTPTKPTTPAALEVCKGCWNEQCPELNGLGLTRCAPTP